MKLLLSFPFGLIDGMATCSSGTLESNASALSCQTISGAAQFCLSGSSQMPIGAVVFLIVPVIMIWPNIRSIYFTLFTSLTARVVASTRHTIARVFRGVFSYLILSTVLLFWPC